MNGRRPLRGAGGLLGAQPPARHLPRHHPWTAQELRLLSTAPDAEVAEKVGRTALAVTVKRNKLGIPAAWGWTEAQVALLGTLPDAEVAARIGRTESAVRLKRCKLGIPNPFDGRRKQWGPPGQFQAAPCALGRLLRDLGGGRLSGPPEVVSTTCRRDREWRGRSRPPTSS